VWNIKPYDSFDEMAADPGIDALVIGSVNPYHFYQINKGLENNKHLLVEKPVVTDIELLRKIKEMVSESSVKLFPAHNFVYRNSVRKAKEIIESGKLGKIIYGSFIAAYTISQAHSKGWRANKEISAGGALMDSGHHVVYQSLYLMGKPAKLQAFTSKMVLNNMDCEDIAQINVQYPDNSLAVIMQSWTSNYGNSVNGIKIFGDKGEIAITDALYFNGEKLDTDVDYDNSFVNQAKAFTDYILYDVPPLSSLDDAEDTLKIIQSAYESAERNVVINF
jgi:predicted dehydrogenase